jgi:hypothetical protein
MKSASSDYIDQLFTSMQVPKEHRDRLLRNITNKVSYESIGSWCEIKKILKGEGYTHLPNGDDL